MDRFVDSLDRQTDRKIDGRKIDTLDGCIDNQIQVDLNILQTDRQQIDGYSYIDRIDTD